MTDAAAANDPSIAEVLALLRKNIDSLLATPDNEFARASVAGLIRDPGLGRWLIGINNLTAWSCQREADGLVQCASWCGRCIASLRDSGAVTDTPEYTAEQVAEVVEGLTAIITEPAECWHPTHISRDDIRTVLAEIKRLTLQVEGHNPFSSNPAETCVPMTEHLALCSRLESAERQLGVFRAHVESEDLKRRQKATGNYQSSSNQGKTNG